MFETTDQITAPTVTLNDFLSENAQTAALLVNTAQQAVLPRQLRDGELYAVLDADGAVQIVPTPGYELDVKDARGPRPRTIRRAITVTDVASLLDYIGEHTITGGIHAHDVDDEETGALEAWANLDDSTVTAILDGYDGWRSHTATLQLAKSREFTEWLAIDGKHLDQERFAEFIEDHLSQIAEPDGAKLLEICQTLTGHTNVQWRSQTILANGQRQLKWEENVEAKAGGKGDLTIPAELRLVLRPYQGGEPVAVTARFRYRLRNGEMGIGIKLSEPERLLEDAFNLTVQQVQAGLPEGVAVRHGRG